MGAGYAATGDEKVFVCSRAQAIERNAGGSVCLGKPESRTPRILAQLERPCRERYGIFARPALKDVLLGEGGDTDNATALPNACLRGRAGDLRVFKARRVEAQEADDLEGNPSSG